MIPDVDSIAPCMFVLQHNFLRDASAINLAGASHRGITEQDKGHRPVYSPQCGTHADLEERSRNAIFIAVDYIIYDHRALVALAEPASTNE